MDNADLLDKVIRTCKGELRELTYFLNSIEGTNDAYALGNALMNTGNYLMGAAEFVLEELEE